ncbi:malic enzyme, NAD binding domain protein, partial [Vibrio parahaemolyticus EKP-028]
NQRY